MSLPPNIPLLGEGVPDPLPWALAHRYKHLVVTNGKIRISRTMAVSLFIHCYRQKSEPLKVFVASNKPFFSLVGGYSVVKTGYLFVPTDDNVLDPIKMCTYYGNHPGWKRSFRHGVELRKALSESVCRQNFAAQRKAVQNAEGLYCFHPMCSSPYEPIQKKAKMPFSLCLKCFDLVESRRVHDGAGFFHMHALPKPMQFPDFLAWLDPLVLCALMCVKHVCHRRKIALPRGITPETLRSLGLLVQHYPHGFQIPKTPEMLLLLKYTMSEAYNITLHRYFPPKLTTAAVKFMLKKVDETGCDGVDIKMCSLPLLIHKTWVPRLYAFEPAYYVHKGRDEKMYLLSQAYAKLSQIIHRPADAERRVTFHVIAEEPTAANVGVAMTTEWLSFEGKQMFTGKCASDGCEMLCTSDYPLCKKCSPDCEAPFCERKVVSGKDNMCSECGGGFEVHITISNVHTCTYKSLLCCLEGRLAAARKIRDKKIAEMHNTALVRCKRKVMDREAKRLAAEYAESLKGQPIQFYIEFRGCALTKVEQLKPMWNSFFSSSGGDDGLHIEPFVGSAANNNAFLFLIGCATSPDKDASISYSNYYDPMCLASLPKEEVEAFNSLAMPSALFLRYSQFSLVGAAAQTAVDAAKGAVVDAPDVDCVSLWSDDEDAGGGPAMKRTKVVE